MALALQFNDTDAQLFQNYANYNNESVYDFVRKAVLARVEHEKVLKNAKNLSEIENAVEEYKKEKGSPLTSEDMPKLIDIIADVRIEQVAAERLSTPAEKVYTFDEMLSECGITKEELDAMPEVEIE
ncbi:MAG: hypothetical protein IJU00_14865 [Selenomonas sp.]|nr:hypothetical protein [Selenomonas sp.]